MKMLPSKGNIFEGYGLLIFYKKGHFKFNFSYFDKNPPPFPTEEKWKKNSQNSKMLSNSSKKCFYTNFKSASDDVISFEKLAWRHFVWRAFHIYLFYLINCKIMMRSICKLTLKPTFAVNNVLEMDIVIILSPIFCDI